MCVLSMALYGSKTWLINKAEERHLKSFKMWWWWILLRLGWTVFRINKSVLNEIGESRNQESKINQRKNMETNWTYFKTRGELLHRILEGLIEAGEQRMF